MTLFFILLLKHAIVDLGVQSHFSGLRKQAYISNAHIHYLHHGISTLLIAAFFVDPLLAVACAIIDYLAHWHIDWGKHRINTAFSIKSRSRLWWWTNSVDQLLHFVTYYIIVLIGV